MLKHCSTLELIIRTMASAARELCASDFCCYERYRLWTLNVENATCLCKKDVAADAERQKEVIVAGVPNQRRGRASKQVVDTAATRSEAKG